LFWWGGEEEEEEEEEEVTSAVSIKNHDINRALGAVKLTYINLACKS
jgi:hypothetical protein